MLKTYEDLFLRDLLTLRKEVSSYTHESDLWKALPGTTNSSGHLTLHLIGNLHHFIGKGMGNTGYDRDRPSEFTGTPTSQAELLERIDELAGVISQSFKHHRNDFLSQDFPLPWREGLHYPAHFMLPQLVLHFNYHLGQINYHRRYFEAQH